MTKIDYITVTALTGISIGQIENGFEIYPNPANDGLTIEMAIAGQYSIEISSLNGQLIVQKSMEGTTHQIDRFDSPQYSLNSELPCCQVF